MKDITVKINGSLFADVLKLLEDGGETFVDIKVNSKGKSVMVKLNGPELISDKLHGVLLWPDENNDAMVMNVNDGE